MRTKHNNFLLVIEGLDGSGKTEIAYRLAQLLQRTLADNVKLTFEPYDPACGGLFIRQVLRKKLTVSPRTLALAFAANRADHADREVEPFLSQGEGRIVICDRYYLSSLVYQSNPSLPIEAIMALNESVRTPDLTIFLSASSQTCYERMNKRAEDKELFEQSLQKTRAKYQQAIEFLRRRGEKIVEVEAEGTIAEVLSTMLVVLSEAGPAWLELEQPLPNEGKQPEVFSLHDDHGLTIGGIAGTLYSEWTLEQDDKPLLESLPQFKTRVEEAVKHMSFNEVGSLFVDYLRMLQYQVMDKLTWTELDAFELEYELPMGLTVRGTALLLREDHKPDIVTQKVWGLDQLTDFMIVFDPGHGSPLSRQYARDVVYRENTALSPSTQVVTRAEIALLIAAVALANYANAQADTLQESTLLETIAQWNLQAYWDVATALTD